MSNSDLNYDKLYQIVIYDNNKLVRYDYIYINQYIIEGKIIDIVDNKFQYGDEIYTISKVHNDDYLWCFNTKNDRGLGKTLDKYEIIKNHIFISEDANIKIITTKQDSSVSYNELPGFISDGNIIYIDKNNSNKIKYINKSDITDETDFSLSPGIELSLGLTTDILYLSDDTDNIILYKNEDKTLVKELSSDGFSKGYKVLTNSDDFRNVNKIIYCSDFKDVTLIDIDTTNNSALKTKTPGFISNDNLVYIDKSDSNKIKYIDKSDITDEIDFSLLPGIELPLGVTKDILYISDTPDNMILYKNENNILTRTLLSDSFNNVSTAFTNSNDFNDINKAIITHHFPYIQLIDIENNNVTLYQLLEGMILNDKIAYLDHKGDIRFLNKSNLKEIKTNLETIDYDNETNIVTLKNDLDIKTDGNIINLKDDATINSSNIVSIKGSGDVNLTEEHTGKAMKAPTATYLQGIIIPSDGGKLEKNDGSGEMLFSNEPGKFDHIKDLRLHSKKLINTNDDDNNDFQNIKYSSDGTVFEKVTMDIDHNNIVKAFDSEVKDKLHVITDNIIIHDQTPDSEYDGLFPEHSKYNSTKVLNITFEKSETTSLGELSDIFNDTDGTKDYIEEF